MSTPTEPPKLTVPGQTTPPPGNQQFYIANRNGNVTSTHSVPSSSSAARPATAARTNPGFFKELIAKLTPARVSVRGGLAMSGLGAAALALDVVATLNLGDPFLYYDQRETWKDMSGSVDGSRMDVWRGYFEQVSPNWKGHASDMLARHVRFSLDDMFKAQKSVSDEMSSSMHGQFWEVLQYDLSVFSLYAASAPIFRTLATMSATHPLGRAVLVAQATAFTGLLGNLVKQFSDIVSANESSLNKTELKLNDLRAAYYMSGNPDLGQRQLGLADVLSDEDSPKDLWIPAKHPDAPVDTPTDED
ncbi:hypothetical protein [Nonomuraea basaltis]|uniref:hypothetical protein n=1 Tax=Nonomuraea basaltis TaxID=2495887 RepID=UPI00110C42E9|nr:hypothetical protein [Nonomuraea basaltis]TMR96939.1 hypothetical protein EJK15_20365 [Nonomuraea basaltis]